jgi:UPF0716 family protein affecting phage T7 exclusion
MSCVSTTSAAEVSVSIGVGAEIGFGIKVGLAFVGSNK